MKATKLATAKGRPPMSLTYGSGKVRRDPAEEDIRGGLAGQSFAILAVDDSTFIQCISIDQSQGRYQLEYQEGSPDARFRASDPTITSDRVVNAFCKYLGGDESWRVDFHWEIMANS
ncbi:MAG: hypothetical protein JWN86_1810 [Planctomycetota bacterium]|nr:hypothetical protein [Planctomycetota bacterium]